MKTLFQIFIKVLLFIKDIACYLGYSYISEIFEKEAKAGGRSVRNYNDKIWSEKRYQIMVNVLKEKFRKPELQEILLATGNKCLVEGSPFDKIWGVGIAFNDDRIFDEKNWRGQNLLGKALEEVRAYYQ